jgi:hypothetical protein
MDVVGMIMEYEDGDMSDGDTLKLFAELVKSGQAWSLQGHYGRVAQSLIDGGYITRAGVLTEKARKVMKPRKKGR